MNAIGVAFNPGGGGRAPRVIHCGGPNFPPGHALQLQTARTQTIAVTQQIDAAPGSAA